MRIRAKLRYMAANEIAAMIDPARMRTIKQTDARPVFKAFVVGHEGEATGNMLGVGNVVKRWFSRMVERLHDKISAGLQLFHGHAEGTNDQAGRQPIGEVVGKKLDRISGRLSSVVACYIYPSYSHLPLDVASVEADVEMEGDGRRGLVIADVERVTGIALGNSAIERPGFEGATLLGQLQAFAKSKNIGDVMDITIEEVKLFLKAEPLKPSDLFGVEDLTNDPAVKGLIESEKRSAVAGEYAHRKRTEEGFDKTRKDLEDKVKAAEVKAAGLELETAKTKVGDLFARRKVERKLTDQQVRFIEARLARFAPSKADTVEKELDSFLDQQVDDYKQIAQVFGVKLDAPGGEARKGAEPPDGTAPETPEDELYDPKHNELLKFSEL